jgi:hypothetical protein
VCGAAHPFAKIHAKVFASEFYDLGEETLESFLRRVGVYIFMESHDRQTNRSA